MENPRNSWFSKNRFRFHVRRHAGTVRPVELSLHRFCYMTTWVRIKWERHDVMDDGIVGLQARTTVYTMRRLINTLRSRQNGRHFVDIFKCIFLNENVWIPMKISMKLVPKGPINNIPALVRIMAWRRPGDKPLSEPMMARLLTHICVTRPQWVKTLKNNVGDGRIIFQ